MPDLPWRDCSETTQNMFIDWTIQHLANRVKQGDLWTNDAGVMGEWASEVITRRLTLGREKYQSHIYGFQGDPLLHLIEEQFDAFFYTFILWRRDVEENDCKDEARIIPLIRCQVAALVESFSMLSLDASAVEQNAWSVHGKNESEMRSPQTFLHLAMDKEQELDVRRDAWMNLLDFMCTSLHRELYGPGTC